MEQAIQKIFESNKLALDRQDFMRQFFPLATLGETYEWNGIQHFFLASGGLRDVYAHPNLEYVLKVSQDEDPTSLNAKSNAYEYYHYLETLESETRFELVPTYWIDESPLVTKQDFLVVLNLSRAKINELFSGVFKPEWTNINDIYGFQYGLNPRTGTVQIYDYADRLIHENWSSFENYWDSLEGNFESFEFEKIFEFKNGILRKAKEMGIFEELDFCNLEHQSGLFLDYTKNEISADEDHLAVAYQFADWYNIRVRKS